MSAFTTGLRQVTLPDQSVTVIAGYPGCGKTTAATHLALRAALAGRRVTYLDPEAASKPKERGYLHVQVVEMLQKDVLHNIRYVGISDIGVIALPQLKALVVEALKNADLVIFENLNATCTLKRMPVGAWQDTIALACDEVHRAKRPLHAVFTVQANREPAKLPALPPSFEEMDALHIGSTDVYLVPTTSKFIGATQYEVHKRPTCSR